MSPPQIVCLVVGVAAWAGLYFRDSRVRQLMPFKVRGNEIPDFERASERAIASHGAISVLQKIEEVWKSRWRVE